MLPVYLFPSFLFFFFKGKVGEFNEIDNAKEVGRTPRIWSGWSHERVPEKLCDMLIRCAESSILVGCSCNVLIGSS
jgi:hypothetical protein